jgi:hypothetical protein
LLPSARPYAPFEQPHLRINNPSNRSYDRPKAPLYQPPERYAG